MLIFRLKLQITVSGGYLIALETVKVEFFQPPSKSVSTVRKEGKKRKMLMEAQPGPLGALYISPSPPLHHLLRPWSVAGLP